jgi:hypothetical protein
VLNAGCVASRRETFPFGLRRLSPSRSNLGGGSHLATSRSSLAPAVIRSTYRAPTTRAHDTPSVAADCGRRSIRSVVLYAVHELPRLQTSASFRRSRSVSPPTTRVPSGGRSWWFWRTNHHGSARQTPSRHIRSRATPTAPRGGRRSRARRYLHAPATYASSSRGRAADIQQPSGQLGHRYGASSVRQPVT